MVDAIILDSKEGANLGGDIIIFDYISTVEESYKATVSKYKVERGTDKTDNVNIQNPTFSTSICVQNSPLGNNLTGNLKQNNVVNAIADRVKTARDTLKSLYNTGSTFNLVTKYETFPNCVITSLELPRNVNNYELLTANITFEQQRFFTEEVTTLIDLGNLTPTAISPKSEEVTQQSGRASIRYYRGFIPLA